MTSNWTSTPTPRSGGGGGGLFIKLEDGQHVDVVPLSDVRVRFRRWIQSAGKYEDAEGPGSGVRAEYLACVFDVAEGAQRILTLNAPTFDDMKTEIGDAGGDIVNVFRIRRKGRGKDTRYTVKVLGTEKSKAAEIKRREGEGDLELAGVDPATVDWDAASSGSSSSSSSRPDPLPSGAPVDDDIPF